MCLRQRGPVVSWAAVEGAFPGGCRKRFFLSASHWAKPHLVCCVQFCTTPCPTAGDTWTYWQEFDKGLQKWWRDWRTSEGRCWESWAWKKGGWAIVPMSISTWREGAKKMESGSGAQGQDTRQRAEIVIQEVFRWHLLYCACDWALAYVAHIALRVSKTVWTRPWEAVLGKYAWDGR